MIHCPGCGAGLRFDIASQMMVCSACDGRYDPDSTRITDKEAQGQPMFDAYVFTCPSCGGELLTTDENDAVGFCPFCGGASMLFDRIHRQWEPEYVIPFQITKEQCKERYVKEVKNNPFVSKRYRDPQLIEGFRGIYMPYWCYDAVQQGAFTVKGDKKGPFARSFYEIRGNIDARLEGYGHDASRAFDDRISEDLAPFDPTGHRPFAPGYLSGFYADIGDVDAHDYDQKGIESLKDHTARLISRSKSVGKIRHGASVMKIDDASTRVPTRITAAHRALYPVWFMSYRNKDKITYAAVNGQTGRVSADLPVSPWRVLLTVLFTGLLIIGAFFILPSIKANVALIVSIILLILGTVILRRNFSLAVNKETGLSETEEAKRFKKQDRIRLLIVIATAVLGAVTAFLDPAYNAVSYLGCLVMAGELFWMMLSHIRFQAEIAKRQPPQFRKKGAAYDEN